MNVRFIIAYSRLGFSHTLSAEPRALRDMSHTTSGAQQYCKVSAHATNCIQSWAMTDIMALSTACNQHLKQALGFRGFYTLNIESDACSYVSPEAGQASSHEIR